MSGEYTILNVMGPYREPKELAMSYDYSVQRPDWATPQGIRVKIALEEELGVLKNKILEISGGSAGQQLRINQILTRAIGDQKLILANEEGLFDDRRDVMIGPFTDSLAYLYPKLEHWMQEVRSQLRQEIQKTVGV
ncbi:hypothetical protein [Candidatus Nitronereus thalassa]|uniref:Uncharacterized protein n=1 Tax=Candidatus Nitronereus thalassa TaxID=3020898 RepID=A0ABU3K4A2_9BACT|nr:hypothetical protein [Candidatus Nitronereus thalassa]MDT7041232.1 hypothetical protein [Candidatus Nitronereus thalassa]